MIPDSVYADPVRLDIAQAGVTELGHRLLGTRADLAEALSRARGRCSEHLGPLPDVVGEISDVARAWSRQADLARRLAAAMSSADAGPLGAGIGGAAYDPVRSAVDQLLGDGGLAVPGLSPYIWPMVVPILDRELLQQLGRYRLGDLPAELHEAVRAALDAKSIYSFVTTTGRDVGLAANALFGMENTLTQWAGKVPWLSEASPAVPAGTAILGLNAARDGAKLIGQFLHHDSVIDKVETVEKIGFEGGTAACMARVPVGCAIGGVSGVAWGSTRFVRWTAKHRKEIGEIAAKVPAELIHQVREVRRGLESVAHKGGQLLRDLSHGWSSPGDYLSRLWD